jgi:hypothetical protein
VTTQPEPSQDAHEDGVRVPGIVAYPLWLALHEHARQTRASGYDIRPEVMAALNDLRTAALAHMSTSRHGNRTLPHDRASDRLVTTGELAGRLGVTGRHVLRLAAAEGITRVAWGRWSAEDADHLVRTHREATTCPPPPQSQPTHSR